MFDRLKFQSVRRTCALGLMLWLGVPMPVHAEVRPPATTLSIGNRVWNDANNNGLEDAGELGVGGVNMRLYDVTGSQFLANTYTDSLGNYLFSNLQAGQYVVELILPPGYVSSSGKNGSVTGPYEPAPDPNNSVDGDDNGTFFSPEALRSSIVDLLANNKSANIAVNNTVDFGIYQPFSIGNRVWHDYNNNGSIDAADGSSPGIDEVQVQLWDMNRRIAIANTSTNNGGYYRFDTLTAGDYVVELTAVNFSQGVLTFYLSSTTVETDPNGDIDNNSNGLNTPYATTVGVRSGLITLGSDRAAREPIGEVDLGVGGQGTPIDQRANMTIDFGFFRTASIGDRVWMDLNGNGTQDPNEPGLPGVTVILNSQKFGSFTTVTDAQGHYTFTSVIPGEQYQVIFNALQGYLRSPYLVGGNDDFDSDADASGQSRWVTLRGGEDMTTLDAGFYAPSMVTPTAPPLPQAPNASPTPFPTYTPLAIEAFKPDAVSPEVATLLAPTVIPGVGDSPAQSPTAAVVPTIVPIESRATIGNKVWLDANRNGVQDVGEIGIANAIVTVYNSDVSTQLTTLTDANGNYTLAGLMPHVPYTVAFQVPRGYTFTTANISMDDTDSDADPSTGLVRGLVLWPGEINQSIDAGVYELNPRPVLPTALPVISPTPRFPNPAAAISAAPAVTDLSASQSYTYEPVPTNVPTRSAVTRAAPATQPRKNITPQRPAAVASNPPRQFQVAQRPVSTSVVGAPAVRRPVVTVPQIAGVRPPPPVIPPNAIIIPQQGNNSTRSVLVLIDP